MIESPSGKKYIGQTIQDVNMRWNQHKLNAKSDNRGCTILNNTINKHGDKMTYSILILCCREELDFYEQEFIRIYDTIAPNGYNITSGGTNGYTISEDLKKQISETKKFVKNDKYKHLPKYIYHYQSKKYRKNREYIILEGYIVKNHDILKERLFCRMTISLEDNLRMALNYLKSADTIIEIDTYDIIDSIHLLYKLPKRMYKSENHKTGIIDLDEINFDKNEKLPKHITKIKNSKSNITTGFRVRRHPILDDKHFTKYDSLRKSLDAAIQYITIN